MSLETYAYIVGELEQCIAALETFIPLPERIKESDGFVFRHKDEHKIPELAAFLKAVRIVSLLNASLTLLREGYTQAVYILCRAIDESVEDIIFLSVEPPDENAKKRRTEFLDDFYQEEFADSDDPLSSISRKTVGRKHIRAALGAIPTPIFDPSLQNHISKSLAQVYSGFVHGAYGFIMELFGGWPPRFHTNSMAETPPAAACEEEFKNQVYRSIVAVNAVARSFGQADMSARLKELAEGFDDAVECRGNEGMEKLRKRLNGLPSRRTTKKAD